MLVIMIACFLDLRVAAFQVGQRFSVLPSRDPFSRAHFSSRPTLSSFTARCASSCGKSRPDHELEESSLNKKKNLVPSTVQNVLKNLNLLPDNDSASAISPTVAVVSVSGGCDSVALLHALCQENVLPPQVQLHVAHFHHHQRPGSADLDCDLVEDLCRQYELQCHIFHWNRNESTMFTQEVARNWRLNTLKSLVLQEQLEVASNDDKASNASKRRGILLTAHHLDDSYESLLLKVLRGVHISNIRGMQSVRELEDDNILLIRPLLSLRKHDLYDYLRSKNYIWREDESNAETKYQRNKVRNQLIPLLEELVGGADILEKRLQSYQQQSEEIHHDLTSRASAYLDQVLEKKGKVFRLNTTVENQEVVSSLVQSQALYQWISSQIRPSVGLLHTQLQRVRSQLEDHPDSIEWTLELGSNYNVVRRGMILMVQEKNGSESTATSLLTDIELRWSIVNQDALNDDDKVKKNASLLLALPNGWSNENALKLSTVGTCDSLRFVPSWRKGRSPTKLRQFLRGQDVPLEQREDIRVVVLGNGNDSSCVAVEVNNEWMIHADYQPPLDESCTTHLLILQVELP